MPVPDPYAALRQSVAFTVLTDVRHFRVRGEDATEELDRLCAGDLKARDGQLQHALMLDDAGRCFADLHVGRDGDEYLLLVEGPTAAEFLAHALAHVRPGARVELVDLGDSTSLVSLDGPYAWELLGMVAGPEAIGLPHLTFFHLEGALCWRAGKTGEYGYGLVLPSGQLASVVERLQSAGCALDAVRGDRAALDQCALENFYFNIRREGRSDATPAELQLQWRLGGHADHVGVASLRRAADSAPRRRLTCLVGPGPYAEGDEVFLDDAQVGRVLNAGSSPVRGDWVALALLDVRCAHPGIGGFMVSGAAGSPAVSVSPPVLDNRSLFVSPQLHSYVTRHEQAMPPIPRRWS